MGTRYILDDWGRMLSVDTAALVARDDECARVAAEWAAVMRPGERLEVDGHHLECEGRAIISGEVTVHLAAVVVCTSAHGIEPVRGEWATATRMWPWRVAASPEEARRLCEADAQAGE